MNILSIILFAYSAFFLTHLTETIIIANYSDITVLFFWEKAPAPLLPRKKALYLNTACMRYSFSSDKLRVATQHANIAAQSDEGCFNNEICSAQFFDFWEQIILLTASL